MYALIYTFSHYVRTQQEFLTIGWNDLIVMEPRIVSTSFFNKADEILI